MCVCWCKKPFGRWSVGLAWNFYSINSLLVSQRFLRLITLLSSTAWAARRWELKRQIINSLNNVTLPARRILALQTSREGATTLIFFINVTPFHSDLSLSFCWRRLASVRNPNPAAYSKHRWMVLIFFFFLRMTAQTNVMKESNLSCITAHLESRCSAAPVNIYLFLAKANWPKCKVSHMLSSTVNSVMTFWPVVCNICSTHTHLD